MASSFIERQVEDAVRDAFDDRAVRFMRGLSKIASRQGGESMVENYQLLGKRALIVLGAVVLTVQVTTSIVGFVRSRKNEERRIERVVYRVLEEERQKELESATAMPQ